MPNYFNMPGALPEDQQALNPQVPIADQVPVAASEVAPEDPRLTRALEEQSKLQLYSNLLKGVQQIASSNAVGHGYKPDFSGSDILSQAAKQPVENYKTQLSREDLLKKQKIESEKFGMEKESHKSNQEEHGAKMDAFQQELLKKKLDFTNEQLTSDPASEESKTAQDRVLQKQKELGQPVNEASVRGQSAKQLTNLFKYLQDDAVQYYKNLNDQKDRTSKEKMSEEDRKSKESIAQINAGAKVEAVKQKQDSARSEGQKAVDKKYAVDYNDFTRKGHVNVKNSIEKLEAIATELEKDQGIGESGGGRIASVLPEVMRDRDAIRRRDAARNEANSGLKALFPGALSDDERKAASQEFYNDALDNKENAKIIRRKVIDMKMGLNQELAKAKYFENNKGTLEGFTGSEVQSSSVKMQAPDGSIRMIPKDQAEAAKAAGGVEVQ